MATLKQIKEWGNAARSICVLPTGTNANNAAPSLVTDGVKIYPDATMYNQGAAGEDALCFNNMPANIATLVAKFTVNAGQVLVATLTGWGYHPGLGAWIEIPLNGGTRVTAAALAESDPDIITFYERIPNLGHFSRFYLQLTGIGGTGAAGEAWLTVSMEAF